MPTPEPQDEVKKRDDKKSNLLTDYLRTFTQLEAFIEKVTGLGIIRDAEDKPAQSAFDSACDSLKAANIQPPGAIGEAQQIPFRERLLNVGVFILPNCQDEGMLESLCLKYVEIHHATTLQCVDNYYDCLKDNGVTLPTNLTKARTWTFLAAQNLSDPLVGRAAQANIWPWDDRAFDQIKQFLRSL